MKKIAIIGSKGYVGAAYVKLLEKKYDLICKDPRERVHVSEEQVNECEFVIVCVPTPMNEDGSCDTSLVEETIKWLKTPLILIKSTVPPHTTKLLKAKYNKRICFSPEYIGEGGYFIPFWKFPHPTEIKYHDFMVIGGDPEDREDILDYFYPVLGPTKTYYQVDETTAELIKYMENASIAVKVTMCNEFYELAKTFGVSYPQVREGYLLDSRKTKMFTCIFKDKRGFDGKCLPKDVNALVKAAQKEGYEPEFLKEVLKSNDRFKSLSADPKQK